MTIEEPQPKTDANGLPDFHVLDAEPAAIVEAARVLRAGGLVAFPTETVYGLGADATNDKAVAAIFEVKERPEFNPLIIHVKDEIQAAEYAEFDERAQDVVHKFWPGALTVVLPRKADSKISLVASAGLDTIALRAPDHPVAQALLSEAGVPIAAPSANRSGYISPTQALHVLMQFKDGEGINIIIDGGPCPVGVESTILDLTGEVPTLLRPGGVPLEDLEAVLGPITVPGDVVDEGGVKAPGQLKSHYAPSIPMRINVDPKDRKKGESLLTFGPDMPKRAALNLSKTGDLREAAANLFTMMRALDMPGIRGIAVVPIPNVGLGRAINDRLKRAAAPKDGEDPNAPPKAYDPIAKIEI